MRVGMGYDVHKLTEGRKLILGGVDLSLIHIQMCIRDSVNVKMIDQGSSELNIIIGVENRDFETAVKAIYDIFVLTQM